MKDKLYDLTDEEKETIEVRLKDCLEKRSDILFAYLHGSFITGQKFRDIDLAVFPAQRPSSPLDFELSLEAELAGIVRGYPFDVRVLNRAPVSFQYNVIKYGKRLFTRDDDARCDFEEAALSNYFDFAPFRKGYLKEALGLGI